jgi:hypothetical protein
MRRSIERASRILETVRGSEVRGQRSGMTKGYIEALAGSSGDVGAPVPRCAGALVRPPPAWTMRSNIVTIRPSQIWSYDR